jgi:hypothetical protein
LFHHQVTTAKRTAEVQQILVSSSLMPWQLSLVAMPYDPAEGDALGINAPAWSSTLELLRHGGVRT